MDILLYIIFTLLGLAIGSFLNVIIDRLPAGKSIVFPSSHCDACGHKLSFIDLIPVLSYLMLRGRCRYCQACIPWRVLWVELISGVIFLLAYWHFAASIDPPNYAALFITAFWSCVFLVIMFIDWEHKLILNRITYPAALAALVIMGIATVFPETQILGARTFIPDSVILSSIIGGAIGFSFFFIIFLINPGGMGMGDIKLACLIGLVTGLPLVIVALLIGIFIGGLAAIMYILIFKKGRKDVIPYGTFLSIGPMITLLWGNEILDWYLGFF